MGEKEYVIPYSKDARKRHYHHTSKGKVVGFVVQLEVLFDNGWREVIRYDCAHGYAHRDSYCIHGKQTKEELCLTFEETLTFADDDIDGNWESYKKKFLKGEIL